MSEETLVFIKAASNEQIIIRKFNPYHDRLGRFATAPNGTSFTIASRQSNAQNKVDAAVEQAQKQHKAIMPTERQERVLRILADNIRNLDHEEMYLVDRNGLILMQEVGTEGNVYYDRKHAEKVFLGNIVIHNHPSGGSFSVGDISVFEHNPTEIRAVGTKGDYILRNLNPKHDGPKNWQDMQEDLRKAIPDFEDKAKSMQAEIEKRYLSRYGEKCLIGEKKYHEAEARGADDEILKRYSDEYEKAYLAFNVKYEAKINAEAREFYLEQFHQWHKQNAANYGFQYEFIPIEKR